MEERSMDTTCATDPAHATDAELVRDARQGDTAAFEALTARHFPMVYALAYAGWARAKRPRTSRRKSSCSPPSTWAP